MYFSLYLQLMLLHIMRMILIKLANIDRQLILSCDSGDCFESIYEWYELDQSTELGTFKLLKENSSELE